MSILLRKIKYKITGLYKKTGEPPSYEFKRSRIQEYKDRFNLHVLVETGTFFGDTVEFFKTIFERVYSIELAEDLAKRAMLRFELDNNVRIIHGDSADVLKSLIQDINEPVLFWLDGHYSSEFFVGKDFIKTARGKKDTPVEEELKVIFESEMNHVILIDDARLFTGLSDYPSISQIRKLVRGFRKNYRVKVDNDIIFIHP
jgi:hypothetical protein